MGCCYGCCGTSQYQKIRGMLLNSGCWAGEIQLTSYNSIIRYEVAHTNSLDKIGVIRQIQYIPNVHKYMSWACNT